MKRAADSEVIRACEAHLRALQPVRRVDFRPQLARPGRPGADGELFLDTAVGRLTYLCEVKRGLSLPRVEHLLLQLHRGPKSAKAPPLLLSDYLSPRVAERLVEAGINFVDEAGNVYLDRPGKLYIRTQGMRPKRRPEARVGRLAQPSGLQVVFALFADPGSVSMTYRDLAKASGVALGSVARVVRELKGKGYLVQTGHDAWSLTRKRELLDVWLGRYGEVLRPKLVVGRFQPPERDLDRTLATVQQEAGRIEWAVTGGFAAYLLTRHFRGAQLGLFVSEWPARLARRLKWLPSHHGPVTVFRRFSPLVVFLRKDQPEIPIAHPLLVYAELVFQGRERELEAAKLLYDRYLTSLAHGN